MSEGIGCVCVDTIHWTPVIVLSVGNGFVAAAAAGRILCELRRAGGERRGEEGGRGERMGYEERGRVGGVHFKAP